MVRSSGALSSAVAASRRWPKPSRTPQRRMLATQSFASTGEPSWNFSPVRSFSVQRSPSAATSWLSTIWGWAT